MGTAATGRQAQRQIRRALGGSAADHVAIIDQRSRTCAAILRRGFFGRLKWLFFGR